MFFDIQDGSRILHLCRSKPHPLLNDIAAANHVAPNIITPIIIAPQVPPDVATADLPEEIGRMAEE